MLFIVVTLLSGCAPEDKRLDFKQVLPEEWSHYETYRLDTNANGQKEWVILYNFDKKEKAAFSPVGGVVYHAERGRPAVIYPYPLKAPGWEFLGTGKSSIGLKEVLTGAAGPELVFKSVDSAGTTTRVVLFHWQDHVTDPTLPPVANAETGQWYDCIGKFDGAAGVRLERDRVTVWKPAEDRSQLAIRRVYLPVQGSYMQEQTLIEPGEVCLDFAYGQPQNVDKSPYPEKVLMAFYHNFITDQAYQYLTKDAQKAMRNRAGNWANIAPWPRATVTGICVKELNYNPDAETVVEAERQMQALAAVSVQATTDALATRQACPQPDTTCAPTNTPEIVSEPVLVIARVEYHLENQKQEMRLGWKLVKINNSMWRIDQVSVLH